VLVFSGSSQIIACAMDGEGDFKNPKMASAINDSF
jgi:hypothetical protein